MKLCDAKRGGGGKREKRRGEKKPLLLGKGGLFTKSRQATKVRE